MKTNPNDAATGMQENDKYKFHRGLTKREYFAAMALNGLLSNNIDDGSDIVKSAVYYADSLIEKLNAELTD